MLSHICCVPWEFLLWFGHCLVGSVRLTFKSHCMTWFGPGLLPWWTGVIHNILVRWGTCLISSVGLGGVVDSSWLADPVLVPQLWLLSRKTCFAILQVVITTTKEMSDVCVLVSLAWWSLVLACESFVVCHRCAVVGLWISSGSWEGGCSWCWKMQLSQCQAWLI